MAWPTRSGIRVGGARVSLRTLHPCTLYSVSVSGRVEDSTLRMNSIWETSRTTGAGRSLGDTSVQVSGRWCIRSSGNRQGASFCGGHEGILDAPASGALMRRVFPGSCCCGGPHWAVYVYLDSALFCSAMKAPCYFPSSRAT